MLVQQLQADRGGERERRPYIVSEEDAGRRVPWAHAEDLAVQRAVQGGRIGRLEACLGWVAAARRAGAPEAAQCKSSLHGGRRQADGGGGAAAAHLGDDGVQPECASAMTMMRGGCEHVKSMVTSCSHTMNTREHHGRRLSAKNSGRRWTLPAVPMGAGGRPPSVGKLVTSSFPWAVSGVLDGCEVGADRRKNWFAASDWSAAKSQFTDSSHVCCARGRRNRPRRARGRLPCRPDVRVSHR